MTRQKLSHSGTKIGLKALLAKKPHILLALFLLLFSILMRAQEIPANQSLNIQSEKEDSTSISVKEVFPNIVVADSVATDSIPKDTVQPFLTDKIKYKAKDYMRMSKKENRIYLYNQAEVYYQDYELKAGIITIDYTKNEVYAGRIKDSTGNYSQLPYFKQGSQVVEPDSIRFNFDTKKALIWNSRSEQSIGETMNVDAEITKKENDSVYFLYEGKLTTSSNPDNPDYYIRVRKAKFVPKKKVIAGFSNMYLADVPTPIAVPFAYFPMTNEKRSGILFPTFGETQRRGYFLQNGGYYFAISDYFDLALLGDYYTNGSYGIRSETSYALKYKFRGSLRFRYENLVNGQRGFPDYSRSVIYNIQWTHSQDAKANPNSRLSASVNLGSNTYYTESINQINTANFLNNTLASSVSYSKTFPAYPSVNLSLTANHSQNTSSKTFSTTLPALQASMERIFPFAKRDGIKKGVFQNINFQYSLRAENRAEGDEDVLFKKGMFDNAKNGVKHSIPISTNFKLFKYFSLSMGTNYEEVWQFKTIRKNDYNNELEEFTIDTLSGFDRFNKYNFSASLGTTLYGTFNFGENRKIQAIRHVVRPSISYGYTPAFDQYYDEYIADEFGNIKEYTRFEGGLFGSPSKGRANSMGISLSNVIEAKVRDKDTTVTEPKKITLLNNLNFSTAYNFEADSLAWSPVRVSGGTSLFQNKMSVNFGATLDPYAIDPEGRKIDVFNIDNGGSLFRLTSANMNVSYSFSSKSFEGGGDSQVDNTASGGRDDDLFGDSRSLGEQINFDNNSKDQATDKDISYYNSHLPWDLRIAYSLTYSNSNRQNSITNNSLMFSGNIELTPKWKVGVSSGYDFKNHGFTYTQFRINRDLDSFKINFNWVPFSNRASWYFFIGIKSSMLSDLKWEQRREPDRNL
ncbi:putative LPS assembly protein LptD [Abyssalbus ytuae]|uniref:LPS-assembly protein LptD n=1 Tax=Abyssalbus ytuae TaxID=2926907 RepID=A0A9E6ZWQ7_9FLAO|nr:putative LPS assembly protein LptD [Abyssalbus ytuae]UOB18211.1 LPS-assembly protein LptD [Abyssalbus ytuae]